MRRRNPPLTLECLILASIVTLALFGCSQGSIPGSGSEPGQLTSLSLPVIEPVELNGGPLRVIATTSIIGDIVARVGGGAIELTTLIGPGQDPHSYEPAAQDLAAASRAHVIFVNGWDLEEALALDLAEIAGAVPIVPVSAGIEPLALGQDQHEHDEAGEGAEEPEAQDDHGDSGADPHVWFSIPNVKIWVDNLAQVLGDLDPAGAATYRTNAAVYLSELTALEAYAATQLGQIPEEKRYLVTNHDSLNYLANDYGFTVLGTVIPAASTVAEPSARAIASLVEEMEEQGVCTLFTETTVSDSLAETVAAELDGCDQVRVLGLYTGAVGPPGSGADSYIGMYRANVDTLVSGLK